MGLMINKRKLDAAANSMHQFCQEVRSIYPGPAEDAAIEAATLFLYLQMSRDLFGPRFTTGLNRQLQQRLKYSNAPETKARITRIAQLADARERAMSAAGPYRDADEKCRGYVTSVLRALLVEAGYRDDDPELIRSTYATVEQVIRDMKKHLSGINEQNHFIFKPASENQRPIL